jgi:hypothetical protein
MPAERQHEYKKRLLTELDVIIGKGFEGYFLIVWDMVRWARSQRIPTGYGRGSAGGSLVSWLLGIVELDPVGPVAVLVHQARRIACQKLADHHASQRQARLERLQSQSSPSRTLAA